MKGEMFWRMVKDWIYITFALYMLLIGVLFYMNPTNHRYVPCEREVDCVSTERTTSAEKARVVSEEWLEERRNYMYSKANWGFLLIFSMFFTDPDIRNTFKKLGGFIDGNDK